LGATPLGQARFSLAGAFAAGKFIVSGGWDEGGANRLADAETWDESQAGWQPAGTMPSGSRTGHSMTVLGNGRDVLVIGGCQMDHAMTAVDLYRADVGEWSIVAPMNLPRCGPESVLLADGRVLVSGGSSFTLIGVHNSVEIYDPANNSWTLAAPMSDKRFDHRLALLPDGRVIAVAGSNDDFHGELGALSSAEVYDPVANTWTPLPMLHDRRRWPTLAVLSDGVYVAGGAWGEYPATGNPIIQVHVLASVERLSWADLGIAPPNPDAGTTDGAPDAEGGADSASDSAPPAAMGGGGCSCQSSGVGRASAMNALSASALLAIAWLSRRTRRHRHKDIAPRG
jgi:MYXO-CTERM domain-containing protein